MLLFTIEAFWSLHCLSGWHQEHKPKDADAVTLLLNQPTLVRMWLNNEKGRRRTLTTAVAETLFY